MKVAHVIKSLNPGGVEAWLRDLSSIELDIESYVYLQSMEVGFFEKEVSDNGFNITKIPLNRGVLNYSFQLYKSLKRDKIDIIHSHVNLSSGWILLIAYLAGVKKRVVQCHNDKRKEYQKASLYKRFYFRIMRMLLSIFATDRIAVSQTCIPSMFNDTDTVDVIPCGLSFSKKYSLSKSDFGLKDNELIILHVGRFVSQKNHRFILDVANSLKNIEPSFQFKFLLIGDGELKLEIERLADPEVFLFLGIRNDVYDVMSDVADIFVLPSQFEGLGLVAVESQAAGVYTLVSDVVPSDIVVSNRVDFLSLDSPLIWAERIVELYKNGHVFNKSPITYEHNFTIENNYKRIRKVYSR